ncbi:MAG: MauE/DoxX family redox-associated membrane protein, partial [Sphingobacteriales bacterium]
MLNFFLICLSCIFLFLSTAHSKWADHVRFLKGLSRVTFIGGYAFYISWLVPAAEVLISLLLIIPQTYKWGLYGFTGLMTLFTGYIVSMVLWAKKLPFHCGGAIEKLSWAQHIWFNLAFIAIALFALWLSKTKINLKY